MARMTTRLTNVVVLDIGTIQTVWQLLKFFIRSMIYGLPDVLERFTCNIRKFVKTSFRKLSFIAQIRA